MIWALPAWAGDDHAEAAPPPVEVAPAELPSGPPRTVRARPGEVLADLLRTLPAGSTLILEPGKHAGPLVIDRPMTVQAEGAVITGGGRGTVLVIAADDVTVRGAVVSGSGRDPTVGDAGVLVGGHRAHLEGLTVRDVFIGIDLRQADHAVIRGCTVVGEEDVPIGVHGDGIRLWESDDNLIEGNTLHRVRDLVVWYSEKNTIRGNRMEHSRYGVHFMHADDNVVEDNQFDHDVVGVFVMYSDNIRLAGNVVVGADGAAGVGFGFKESDDVTVIDNRLLGGTTGLYLDHTPYRIGSTAEISGNLVAYNHVGIRFHGAHPGAHIHDNDFHENGAQIAVDGAKEVVGVTAEYNRWSDYVGYDLDGDRIGDLPYAPRRLARDLVDRRPVAAFFDHTPAAELLDFLGMLFPLWTPPALLTDPTPRLGGLTP